MRTPALRTGAAAAAAAAALLVGGCGSSDEGGDGKEQAAPSTTESTPDEEAADGSDEEGSKTLTGVWRARSGGGKQLLTIASDGVSLLSGKQVCTGRVLEDGGQALVLECPEGAGEERTNGQVETLEAKTLKVAWNGGATDTYAKVASAPENVPKTPGDLRDLDDLDGLEDLLR